MQFSRYVRWTYGAIVMILMLTGAASHLHMSIDACFVVYFYLFFFVFASYLQSEN